MVDCLLTILVNQICRLFSTPQTPDSIIALVRHLEVGVVGGNRNGVVKPRRGARGIRASRSPRRPRKSG